MCPEQVTHRWSLEGCGARSQAGTLMGRRECSGVLSKEPLLLWYVNACVCMCVSVCDDTCPTPGTLLRQAFTPPKRAAISSEAFKAHQVIRQDLNP